MRVGYGVQVIGYRVQAGTSAARLVQLSAMEGRVIARSPQAAIDRTARNLSLYYRSSIVIQISPFDKIPDAGKLLRIAD